MKSNRLCLFVAFMFFVACYFSYARNSFAQYIDTPYFGVLPDEPISKVFSLFGKTKPMATKLPHSYVLYYDYKKYVGLIVRVYQMDGETIWELTLRKEGGKEAIRNLHMLASSGVPEQAQSGRVKPIGIEVPDQLTLKGLKFGMSIKDVEGSLKTKLRMRGERAQIGWETESGNYGGLNLNFDNGKLVSLTWYGVDP